MTVPGGFVLSARREPATQAGVPYLTLRGAGGVSRARRVPARIRAGVPVPLDGQGAPDAVAARAGLRGWTDPAAGPPG